MSRIKHEQHCFSSAARSAESANDFRADKHKADNRRLQATLDLSVMWLREDVKSKTHDKAAKTVSLCLLEHSNAALAAKMRATQQFANA